MSFSEIRGGDSGAERCYRGMMGLFRKYALVRVPPVLGDWGIYSTFRRHFVKHTYCYSTTVCHSVARILFLKLFFRQTFIFLWHNSKIIRSLSFYTNMECILAYSYTYSYTQIVFNQFEIYILWVAWSVCRTLLQRGRQCTLP